MHEPSGRVDHGADAVVGGADDPAAVFGGAHADDLQMLVARLAFAKPAVVGNIEEGFGAVGRKTADIAGKHGFVADEGGDAVRAQFRDNDVVARLEVSGFGGNFAGDQAERPRHELSEGNQIDLIVAGFDASVGVDQERGVQRGAVGRVRHGAGEKAGVRGFGDRGYEVEETGIGIVKRRGSFGPDDYVRRSGRGQ